MCPFAHPDGFYAVWLIDELVPGVTAVIDDFGVGPEDAVGEPVVPHELPDVLDWIELGTFGRQRDDADIFGHDQRVGHMPSGLIHEQYGMGAGRYSSSDFGKMQVHRFGIAERQDKPCALAERRADRSEYVGRGGALIMRR
jgi:hypothetical protein